MALAVDPRELGGAAPPRWHPDSRPCPRSHPASAQRAQGGSCPRRWVRVRLGAPSRTVEARLVFAAALGSERQQDLYSIREDGSGLARLTFSTWQSESAPRWSPDLSRLAFLVGSELFMLDVRTGAALALASQVGRNGQGLTPAAWSPDGVRLLYPHRVHSWMVELDDGEILDVSYPAEPARPRASAGESARSIHP